MAKEYKFEYTWDKFTLKGAYGFTQVNGNRVTRAVYKIYHDDKMIAHDAAQWLKHQAPSKESAFLHMLPEELQKEIILKSTEVK